MGNSLQDQLLKAGLVDKNKANQAKKERRKQARQQRQGEEKPGASAQSQAQTEKRAHDRSLNERRNEARKQREIAAQVKQLVEKNRHPRNSDEDDTPFYFDNKGKIKKMYVSAQTHKMITAKQLMVVNCNGVFELVPTEIAEKIRQRNPSLVIDLPDEQPAAEDDPYADYQVPDDLTW
ncbi:MAG: DUF2058 domain-containing protein [Candidatus Thiodiazotropha sp. (ex Monitilora ramsayi)]|nr:DUF2058 domain-containing protein [Candidatus Thiodiazotropha sp. (ex Monitilora ramsayi)]